MGSKGKEGFVSSMRLGSGMDQVRIRSEGGERKDKSTMGRKEMPVAQYQVRIRFGSGSGTVRYGMDEGNMQNGSPMMSIINYHKHMYCTNTAIAS